MICSAIMNSRPLTAAAAETVGDGVARLLAHGESSLVVLGEEGRFEGQFGLADLLDLLVPRQALAGNLSANMTLMSATSEMLHAAYQAVRNRSLGDVAERDVVQLHPETPMSEAITLFCRGQGALPVVEKGTRKLLGTISQSDALRAIARDC